MKLGMMLLLTGPLFLLTACGGLTRSNKPPVLVGPPTEFSDSCPDPVEMPEKELTQFEVEQFWMQDRISLIICKNRHISLRTFYDMRDALITGSNNE